MPEVFVPFVVLCVFLVLMVGLLGLAVRRSRRGFAWAETDHDVVGDETDRP